MKKTFKHMIICLAVVIMALSAAPLASYFGVNLGVQAHAAASPFEYDFVSNFEDISAAPELEITGYNASKLTTKKIDIPAKIDGYNVTSIDMYAFDGFINVTSVTIPEGIKKISMWAFVNLPKLKSVTIPKSVEEIGYMAFGYNSGLLTSTQVNGFTINGYTNSAADKYARDNEFKFVSLGTVSPFIFKTDYSDPKGMMVYAYYGTETNVVIPSKVDGKPVTAVYDFDNCDAVSITLPETLKNIYESAFSGCKKLKSIVIPKNVEYVEFNAFIDCPALKDITVLSNAYIGTDAFGMAYDEEKYETYKINDVVITAPTYSCAHKYARDNGIKFVSNGQSFPVYKYEIEDAKAKTICIMQYNGLDKNLQIPSKIDGKTVVSIGADAFTNCDTLTSVVIPETVNDEIYNGAFYNCKNLKSVTVKSDVYIDAYGNAFGYYGDGLYSDDSAKVSQLVIKAPQNSYANYYAIKNGFKFEAIGKPVSPYEYSVTDKNKKTVTIDVFKGSDKVVKIPSKIDGYTVTAIDDYTFYGNPVITDVTIPSTVTSIGENAFDSCTKLKSVIIPTSVKKIGWGAFENCTSLKSVLIPASVSSIDEYAFGYYDNDDFDTVKVSGFTINGIKGSVAEKYAKNNGFKFVDISKTCKHSYSAWKTTKKATATATGLQNRTCSKCGYTEKKTLPKLTTAISKCTITVKNATYTGKEVKPSVTVKNGKTTLKSGTHYTVKYKNNTKIGKATVTITGVSKNGYTGSKSVTFNILPAGVKSIKATSTTSSIKLTWSKIAGATGYRVYKHDGKKWVKVADTKNTNYTISKLKAGTTYKYTVRPYTTVGKVTYWAATYPTGFAAATKPSTPTLKATAGTKQATLSWNKISGATGYVVYMSTSKNGKYKNVSTVKGNASVKYTVKNLSKGKTYYFKVAAYKSVNGSNVYSAASAPKSAKIK